MITHEIDMTPEQIHGEADAAEKVIVGLSQSFNHHDSRPVPEGLRMLWRVQYHINRQRQVSVRLNQYFSKTLSGLTA